MKIDIGLKRSTREIIFGSFLVALINTAVGNEYILAMNGYISKPILSGSGYYSEYMMGYRYLLLITPLLSAALLGAILTRHGFIKVFTGIFIAAIETIIFSFAFLTIFPQMIGDFALLVGPLIYSKEIILFVALPVFPFSFAGGLIGSILGDKFIFSESKEEKEEFKSEVDEWVEFLSNRVEEKERSSEEELSDRFDKDTTNEMKETNASS